MDNEVANNEEDIEEIEPLTPQEIKDFLANPLTWLSISSTALSILIWLSLTRKMGETDPSILNETYEQCCRSTLMNYLSNGGLASLVQNIDYDTCAQLREHIQQTTYICPALWEGELTFQQLLAIIFAQPVLKQLLEYTIVLYDKLIIMSQNSEQVMRTFDSFRRLGSHYFQVLRSLPEGGRILQQQGFVGYVANMEVLGHNVEFLGILVAYMLLYKLANVIRYSSNCASSTVQFLRSRITGLYSCLRDMVIPREPQTEDVIHNMDLAELPRRLLTTLSRNIANELHRREEEDVGDISNMLENAKLGGKYGGAISTPTRMPIQTAKIPQNIDKLIIEIEQAMIDLFSLFQKEANAGIGTAKAGIGGRRRNRKSKRKHRKTKKHQRKTKKRRRR
jgi:hypothetical protein